jgi:ferrous iron transport protein A
MADSKTNNESIKCELDADVPDSALSLLSLQIGEKGKIVKISGGRGACKRLNELGLVPGTEIEVVNKISSGPVMIKVKGSKLALGRGLAAKVFLN